MNTPLYLRPRRLSAWHRPYRSASARGVTLLETMIAVTIMAFILGFTTFLIFMSARNAYNVNTQIRSQTSTTNAMDRSAWLLRQASYFIHWPEDTNTTGATVSRIRFALIGANNTFTTQVLCFNPESKRVEYYASEADVIFFGTRDGFPIPRGTPTISWPGVARAVFNVESEYRLTLVYSFEYSGFALKPTGEAYLQFGQFITDVIARNHFMDEGVQNYAEADKATSNPATL